MKIKKHIPNFFTLMNIVCGFGATAFAYQGDFSLAFYAIIGAAFFDFIDGGAARLLGVQSEVGKQLDSLCDVVSFGVAPGMILFSMMRMSLDLSMPLVWAQLSLREVLLLSTMVLVPAFSALRLAKFNVDTRQTDSFIGLPVPANALLIASLAALLTSAVPLVEIRTLLLHPLFLIMISTLQSYLLISSLPMFALKFKNLSWQDNKLRFLFLLFSLIVIILFREAGIVLVIVMYVLLSLTARYISR